MRILIIGGSGGIGHALIKRAVDQFPSANITATFHRQPPPFEHPNIDWQPLDVTADASIAALAESLDGVDILINAVGMLHSSLGHPEKTIRKLDTDFFEQNIRLNTLPSLLLAKHFMPALKASEKACFVTISARIGSISDNRFGGWISYRSSKAALNMAMKTISIEWKTKLPQCCVLLFHPGTTDTALSKPFQNNLPEGQLHSPEVTAQALIDLIRSSGPEDSGKFFSFDGSEIPW